MTWKSAAVQRLSSNAVFVHWESPEIRNRAESCTKKIALRTGNFETRRREPRYQPRQKPVSWLWFQVRFVIRLMRRLRAA